MDFIIGWIITPLFWVFVLTLLFNPIGIGAHNWGSLTLTLMVCAVAVGAVRWLTSDTRSNKK